VTWQQQADSAAPTVYRFGCRRRDQLTAAINQNDGPTPTIDETLCVARMTRRLGNRTSEQIDDAVTSASHDALNRLTSQQAGARSCSKHVSEPGRHHPGQVATVTRQPLQRVSAGAERDDDGRDCGDRRERESDRGDIRVIRQARARHSRTTRMAISPATDPHLSNGTRESAHRINVGVASIGVTYDGQKGGGKKNREGEQHVQSDMRVLWCEEIFVNGALLWLSHSEVLSPR